MNNLINDLFNIIDITLIDLNEDKVYLYDKYTDNPSSISYEDYFERCKKSLHPDYANTYFNEISANNLPIDGYKTINFLKSLKSWKYFSKNKMKSAIKAFMVLDDNFGLSLGPSKVFPL